MEEITIQISGNNKVGKTAMAYFIAKKLGTEYGISCSLTDDSNPDSVIESLDDRIKSLKDIIKVKILTKTDGSYNPDWKD